MPDVVVIGGGPAGSAAAYHAARAGLDTLLVDRTAFPRDKTCGDALVPTALRALARMGIFDLPGVAIRGVRVVHLQTGTVRWDPFADHPPPHHGIAIRRRILDTLLLERARSAGAVVRIARAHSLLPAGTSYRVVLSDAAGGSEVLARSVIVAAGSAGRGTLLGSGSPSATRAWGVAGRAYVTLSQPAGDTFDVYFPLRIGARLIAGFAWVFPVSERHVNVGVGVFPAPDMRSLPISAMIAAFLVGRRKEDGRFVGPMRAGPVRRAAIPLGPTPSPRPGILLVGDSAGLANGLTAEGIGAAITSGELAAQAIAGYPRDASAAFERSINQVFPRQLRLAPALTAIHRAPNLTLGRGWDVLSHAHHPIGNALRQLIWDAPQLDEVSTAQSRDAVGLVRREIVRAARRQRPLLGELVSYYLGQRGSAFGRITTFAIAACGRPLPRLSSDALSALIVLETASLTIPLHGALLRPDGHPPDANWGRNTLSLVLADVLTASALRHLYGLPSQWMRDIATVAGVLLRKEAIARATGDDVARSDAMTRMLAIGAAVVAGPFTREASRLVEGAAAAFVVAGAVPPRCLATLGRSASNPERRDSLNVTTLVAPPG